VDQARRMQGKGRGGGIRGRLDLSPSQNTPKESKILQHTSTHENKGEGMRGRRFPTPLQHSATHCETLQHTATHGNTRQRTATHCITRHHTASHGTTLQHDAKHCNNNLSPLALFETIDCNTLQQQPEYTCSFSMHSSFSRQYRYGRV